MSVLNHLDATQHELFSKLYRFMLENQVAFVSPDAPLIPADHWQVVAFNASFAAAHFADPEAGDLVIFNEDDSVLATSENCRATH